MHIIAALILCNIQTSGPQSELNRLLLRLRVVGWTVLYGQVPLPLRVALKSQQHLPYVLFYLISLYWISRSFPSPCIPPDVTQRHGQLRSPQQRSFELQQQLDVLRRLGVQLIGFRV